jgi:hypothetical protein
MFLVFITYSCGKYYIPGSSASLATVSRPEDILRQWYVVVHFISDTFLKSCIFLRLMIFME